MVAQPNAAGTDGPLRSLPAAQAAVRARLSEMSLMAERATVRVRIAPGTYTLTAPLLFEPADSGMAGFPVVWEAESGAVVVSGGTVLPLMQADGGDQMRYQSPNTNLEQIRGAGQLFINDHRAVLARQPDAGSYWFITKPVTVAGEPRGKEGQTAFDVTPDASTWLARLTEADRARAVVNVMQSWSAGRHRFDGRALGAAVRVKPRGLWPFLNFGTSQRFFIENVAAAFDAPGEWFWDESGVHYLPLAAERGMTLRAVMPMLDRLVVIRGDVGHGQWVQYLQFHGITFAETRSLTPPGGMFDLQAAVEIGAAIEVDGARNIELKDCEVTRTGGYAIWFRRAVRESSVSGCELSDLGAGGIKVGEIRQTPGYGNATGANLVNNNRISHIGKVYPGAVAVWIGQSFDNEVSHNTIFDTRYSGISVGWQWGYGVPSSGRNQIIGNLLYNIGQGQLSDMGAIYTLGPSPGTVIANNVIREVRGYPGYGAGAWGIYNDEGTSDVVVENNVVVGTDSGAYHLHYGRNNLLRGNLFAHGDAAEMLVTRSDTGNAGLVMRDNVLVPSVRAPFAGGSAAADVHFAGNLIGSGDAGGVVDLSKCGDGFRPADLILQTNTDPRQVKLSGASSAIDTKIAGIVATAGSTIKSGVVKRSRPSKGRTLARTTKPPFVAGTEFCFRRAGRAADRDAVFPTWRYRCNHGSCFTRCAGRSLPTFPGWTGFCQSLRPARCRAAQP